MAAYGIDLGTTYSALARLNNSGNPEIVPDNNLARDIMASAIFFKGENDVLVGDGAKEEGAIDPAHLMQFFKRWIGLNEEQHPEMQHYIVDGKEYDPIELSSMVLKQIVKYAKESGEDVKDVVITCPAYFDYAQRDATKDAGKLAGLNVLAIVNEPTAAAINYCANRFSEDQTVLVYDLGGGTFDVTLMKMSEKDGQRNVDVIRTDGSAFLGGEDWDERLFDIFLQKYEESYGPKEGLSEDTKALMRAEVEKTKKALSIRETARVRVDAEEDTLRFEVTRAEFEAATTDLVDKTFNWLDSVIADSGMTDSDIDILLMVGGSVRMPMIKDKLIERFGDKAQLSDPDQTVAKGAAIVADMYQKDASSEFIKRIQDVIARGGHIEVDPETGKPIVVTPEGPNIDIYPGPGESDNPSIPGIDTTGKTAEQIMQEIINMDPVKPIDLGVGDVAPRTFGLIVGRYTEDGQREIIVDNVVKQHQQLPADERRTYYVPRDGATHLVIPVVQSTSQNEQDVIQRDENTREYIFTDSSLGQQECNRMLPVLPEGLKEGTPLEIAFSLDNLGNVTMTLYEATTKYSKRIDFNFNSVSEEKLDEMRRNQAGMTFLEEE